MHALCVLRGDASDHACPKHAQSLERFQIGLYPRAPTAIAASNA